MRSASKDGRTASCRACLSLRDKARESPERAAARRAYQATPQGQDRHVAANKAYRKRNPAVMTAHNSVARASRAGRLRPWPCEVCGAKAEAHHPHYGAPLLVTWLCPPHHKQAHAETVGLQKRDAITTTQEVACSSN